MKSKLKYFLVLAALALSITFNNINARTLGIYERPDLYWIQTSDEYENVTRSLYELAKIKLQDNLKNTKLTAYPKQKNDFANLPPAIIMDIDETILNNSKFAVYMQTTLNGGYSDKDWDLFVQQGVSTPIAGTVDFINYVTSKGVQVFFVSNRLQSQFKATVKNLKQVGIKVNNLENYVLLVNGKPNWSEDKYIRYDEIAKNYRIVMLIGDNLTDFLGKLPQNISYKDYKKLDKKYAKYIGNLWIQLPAPTYGSWQNIHNVDKEIKTFNKNS